MRTLALIGALLISFSGFSQTTHDFNAWATIGADGKIVKKLRWSAELNSRFDDQGLKVFFPQVGMEYKLFKWLRPSIEYRFLIEKNKYGNYKPASSLRVNLNFRHVHDKRLKFGARLRYQYSFDRVSSQDYNADFDQAIRFKPYIAYDINDFFLTPELSTEFYFDPVYGPSTPGFTKIRYAVGFGLDMNSPHSVKFKYRLDQRLGSYPVRLRHIVGVSYGYSF